MTAIIIGEGESFYRKGTVMKKTQFEKKKKFRRLAAVSLALCMAAVGMACGNGEAVSSSTEDLTSKYRSEAASQEDVPIEDAFAISYLDFSLQLLRDSRTSGEQKKTEAGEEDKASRGSNTMVSPLSVLTALEMTRGGAGKDTLRQMGETMYPGIDPEEGRKELLSWCRQLPDGKGGQMSMANSIWFNNRNEDFVPNEEFLEKNAKEWKAQIYGAPFDQTTLKDLNGWVEKNTDGMITNILDKIPEAAIMYLVNAVAFDGKWEKPYESYQVHDTDFYPEDGSEAEVPMMYSEESRFLKDEHSTGFVKPYVTGYSFVALLPEEGLALEDYLKQMSGEGFLRLMEEEEQTAVSAGMPKFKADTSLELSEILSGMGMPLAFDADLADFSGIGSCGDLTIHIDRVIHKTHIDVDELGTKAGAATVVEMLAEGAMMQMEKVILDRPFLYAIVDENTKLPVFIGTVEKP